MLPDIGSKGPIERPYVVTETYVGMSSLPYFPTPTPIPYGFTTAVETYTGGAPQPITRTIVVPKTGRPGPYDMAKSTWPLASHGEAAATGTTLITSKESAPETTQVGGQVSGAVDDGASTRGPSTAAATDVQVSEANSSWSKWLLSFGVVVSAFWGVFLVQ